MSSTTNLQNLLVNVFRPIYTYDPISNVYTPKLELSNIDTITANALNVGIFGVGDSNSNVFVGCNAGTGARNSSNNTAVGFNAANSIAYVCNSVYLGFNAGAGVTGFATSPVNDVIAIGANTSGRGVSNIYIGSGTATDSAITSAGNIFIGHGILAGDVSSRLLIGNSSRITIAGDLSTGWVGIGNIQTPTYSYDSLDVSGYAVVTQGLGLGLADPSGYALNVSGTAVFTDGGYTTTINGSNSGTLTQGVYPKVAVLDPSATFPTFLFQDVSSGTMGIRSSENTLAMGLYGSRHIDIATSGSNIQMSTGGVLRATFDSSGLVVFGDISVTGGISVNGLGNGVYGGVLLSNSNVTTSSGSNFIGGVTLNNSNISNLGNLNLSGAIVGSSANTSNQIGGVTLSNNDIGFSGTITGSTANTSNQIGGVVLSNGILRATAGTESAPAYTFANDLSTGLYLAGTSQLGFDTDGIQRMVISNSNVGIGVVPNSLYALDISGTVRGNQGAIFKQFGSSIGGSALAPAYTSFTDIETGIFFPDVSQIGFTGDGIEIMRIRDGRLGIGTSTPATTLDVSGNIGLTGAITGSTANTSNQIGGVTLSNSNITYSGTITGTTANTSNQIGGITLSNGILRVTDGTASAPSYTFANDLSTGIHRVGTSQIGFDTGGVQRMIISNANVGIGTSAPTTLLDVSGTARVRDALLVNDANSAGLRLISAGGNSFIQWGSNTGVAGAGNANLYFTGINSGTPGSAFSILSNGFIGIGTQDTEQHAVDMVTANGLVRVRVPASASTTYNMLKLTNTAAVDNVRLRIGGFAYLDSSIGTAQTAIDFIQNSSSDFKSQIAFNVNTGAGLSEAARITSDRRLGIGNPSPAEALDVSGNIKGNGGAIVPFFQASSGSSAFPAYTTFNTFIDGMWFPGSGQVGFSTGGTQRMIISNANVGIGTITPAYTLDVSGTFAANTAEYTIYLTSSSNVTTPAGFTKAYVTLVAAGGSGGTGSGTAGGGGGGAGWVVKQMVTDLSGGSTTLNFTRGNGSTTPSTNGGPSSLTVLGFTMYAFGGLGGASTVSTTGGAGGNGYFGGGGGSGSVGGAGGAGIIFAGESGSPTASGNGGGALNGGGANTGGGGGGALGGAGGGATGGNGGPGCGGGGCTSSVAADAGDGGNGYCIIKFMR